MLLIAAAEQADIDQSKDGQSEDDREPGEIDHKRLPLENDPGLDEAADLRMPVEVRAEPEASHDIERASS